MRITAIESILLSIPQLRGGAMPVGGPSRPSMGVLLVKVETDAGITGWGEAFGHSVNAGTKATIDSLVAPLYIGRDATAIAALFAEMRQKHHIFGWNGSVLYGLSGIDIALWDIAAKAAGMPLYRLLGGSAKRDLPAYASLLRYTEPKLVATSVAEAVERGYGLIKLHEIDVPQVKAARDALGPDMPLMLDTNCPWTVRQALNMAERLKPYNLHWLEEPVFPPDDHAGLAAVRRLGIPTAAGENAASPFTFRHLFEAGALDFAQPSVTKIGGITGMQKVIALADAWNVTLVPHCAYFGPGFLASLHLVAALPAETPFERLYVDLEAGLFGDLTDPVDGRMRVPQAPGLGCDPDPALVERYRTHASTVIR